MGFALFAEAIVARFFAPICISVRDVRVASRLNVYEIKR